MKGLNPRRFGIGYAAFAAAFLMPLLALQAQGNLPLRSGAWRGDSLALALGSLQGVCLFDLSQNPPQQSAYLQETPFDSGGISALAWSSDGTRLAVARYDGVISVWDLQTQRRIAVMRGHIGSVNGVAFSPDGTLLASGGDDSLVRLWDAATGALNGALPKHRSRIQAIAFQPDGTQVISGGVDNLALLWIVATGESRANPQPHGGPINAFAPKPDGTLYLTGSSDTTVRVFGPNGAPQNTLRGHKTPVIAVGWRGDQVISASLDGEIITWEGETILTRSTLRNPPVHLVFSPEGTRALLIGISRTAQIISLSEGAILTEITCTEQP
ncbi:MAG: WD40 repeat domain-containing protein [Anaerolinea sp.]|nr:WD40 repeat domain-containing protein [Anaerolinea sp.]